MTYNEFITGEGENKMEAFDKAWNEYVYENGHRCSERGIIAAKLLERVPPMKQQSRLVGRTQFISMERDLTAPQAEWLERWEFEVWVHS
jgi:hypothetical protein